MALVLTSVADSIGVITLNNPQKRNALSSELINEITKALAAMSSLDVRVIILRAAKGQKVWSAGHDVNELPQHGGRDPLTYAEPVAAGYSGHP